MLRSPDYGAGGSAGDMSVADSDSESGQVAVHRGHAEPRDVVPVPRGRAARADESPSPTIIIMVAIWFEFSLPGPGPGSSLSHGHRLPRRVMAAGHWLAGWRTTPGKPLAEAFARTAQVSEPALQLPGVTHGKQGASKAAVRWPARSFPENCG